MRKFTVLLLLDLPMQLKPPAKRVPPAKIKLRERNFQPNKRAEIIDARHALWTVVSGSTHQTPLSLYSTARLDDPHMLDRQGVRHF